MSQDVYFFCGVATKFETLLQQEQGSYMAREECLLMPLIITIQFVLPHPSISEPALPGEFSSKRIRIFSTKSNQNGEEVVYQIVEEKRLVYTPKLRLQWTI